MGKMHKTTFGKSGNVTVKGDKKRKTDAEKFAYMKARAQLYIVNPKAAEDDIVNKIGGNAKEITRFMLKLLLIGTIIFLLIVTIYALSQSVEITWVEK